MQTRIKLSLAALAALALGACSGEPPAEVAQVAEPAPEAAAAPYDLGIPVQILMRGPISIAAADYWSSVAIVVDADGEHEMFPEGEEEWERVWASALALAEYSNLLMMPGRALDQGDWMRLSRELYDVSRKAARIAEDEDPMAVLDVGEEIYNVCTECHAQYVPANVGL